MTAAELHLCPEKGPVLLLIRVLFSALLVGSAVTSGRMGGELGIGDQGSMPSSANNLLCASVHTPVLAVSSVYTASSLGWGLSY